MTSYIHPKNIHGSIPKSLQFRKWEEWTWMKSKKLKLRNLTSDYLEPNASLKLSSPRLTASSRVWGVYNIFIIILLLVVCRSFKWTVGFEFRNRTCGIWRLSCDGTCGCEAGTFAIFCLSILFPVFRLCGLKIMDLSY